MEIGAHDSAVDPDKSGEAGALGCKHIVVTSEMVAAGANVLTEYVDLYLPLGPSGAESLAEKVISAALSRIHSKTKIS